MILKQIILNVTTVLKGTQEIPFSNITELNILHNFDRTVDVTIYNNNGIKINGEIEKIDNDNVKISFNRLMSGIAIIQ